MVCRTLESLSEKIRFFLLFFFANLSETEQKKSQAPLCGRNWKRTNCHAGKLKYRSNAQILRQLRVLQNVGYETSDYAAPFALTSSLKHRCVLFMRCGCNEKFCWKRCWVPKEVKMVQIGSFTVASSCCRVAFVRKINALQRIHVVSTSAGSGATDPDY